MKRKKKSIDKQLDELWSELVKIKAGYKCEYCGTDSHLNSHHVFSRSNYSVRWDLLNGICLCAGHHTLNSKFSAHKAPADFIEWYKGYVGEEYYDKLRLLAHSDGKLLKHEKSELLEKFKQFKNEQT